MTRSSLPEQKSPSIVRRTPRSLIGLAIVAGLAGGAVWWLWERYSTDPLAGILTSNAVVDDIELAVLANGTLRPVKLLAVGAQVSGRLTAMKVVVGQILKKGDLVATIDDVSQQNALKTARAMLAAVGAQLEEKQATLGLTRMWTCLPALVPLSVSPMIQRTVSPAATGPEPTSCSPGCRAMSVIWPGAA